VKSEVDEFQKLNEQKAESLREGNKEESLLKNSIRILSFIGILKAQELPSFEMHPDLENQLKEIKYHFESLSERVDKITSTIENCQKKGPEIEQMVKHHFPFRRLLFATEGSIF